jgi:hypothetical protein
MTASLITIEYSVGQRAFHTACMAETCATNIRHVVDGTANDYKIVGCAETQEEAHAFIEKLVATGLFPENFTLLMGGTIPPIHPDAGKMAAAACGKLFSRPQDDKDLF